MATPYDSAIVALEEEITALTAALRVLRRRGQDHQDLNGSKVSFAPDSTSVKAVQDLPTNEEAVEARKLHTRNTSGRRGSSNLDPGLAAGT